MYQHALQIVCIIFCLSLGMVSGLLNSETNMAWYETLNRPSFSPPNWVFGPVWTTLYILIGITLSDVIRSKNKSLIFIYILQLICNAIWTLLFFELKRIDLAALDLLILCILVAIFLFKTKYSRMFYLTIPYFLWISFAYVINLYIYMHNQ